MINVNQLPPEIYKVIDKHAKSYGTTVSSLTINKLNKKELVYNDLILVPGADYDAREATVNAVAKTNLTKVAKISLLGMANCMVYKKTDPAIPAFILFEEMDEHEYFLAEF